VRTAVVHLNKMAARKRPFSVQEVISEVSGDFRDKGEEEGAVPNLEDVLKLSVEGFHGLRHCIDNYSQFKADATACLGNVYRRHESGTCEMDRCLMSTVPLMPMLSTEVNLWIKGIYRRMLANPKARNPWMIELKRDLSEEVFNGFRHAVGGALSSFGVLIGENSVTFININRLNRDFSKFCDCSKSEIKEQLKKSFGGNRKGFKAEVLVTNDKPFSLVYDRKRKQIKLNCSYGCWNEFGYGFHQ